MSEQKTGILLLHGFTSHISCIDPVVPRLQKHNIIYRMPVMRGHMATPASLEGVTWQNWVEDAQTALNELLKEVDRVIIVGAFDGGIGGLATGGG